MKNYCKFRQNCTTCSFVKVLYINYPERLRNFLMVAKCCENRSLTHKARGHSLSTLTRKRWGGVSRTSKGDQVTKSKYVEYPCLSTQNWGKFGSCSFCIPPKGSSIKDVGFFLAVFDTPLPHVGILTLIYLNSTF